MITGISIENFKGIRDRVELELKPLTLLFGANSAGKTSIIHAFHLAREIFERRNLNPDFTVGGGEYVNLGGFQNFVHGHDLDRVLTLGITVRLSCDSLPTYTPSLPHYAERDAVKPSVLIGDVETAYVEIQLAFSEGGNLLFVKQYAVNVNDHPMARILKDSTTHRWVLDVNTANPALKHWNECGIRYSPNEIQEMTELFGDEIEQQGDDKLEFFTRKAERHNAFLERVESVLGGVGPPVKTGLHDVLERVVRFNTTAHVGPGTTPWTFRIPLFETGDAMPTWGQELRLDIGKNPLHFSEDGLLDTPERFEQYLYWIWETTSQLIVGPGELVRDELASFRYLGPLRETPPRNYTPLKSPDESRWPSGLAAWDTLASGDGKLVEDAADWLGASERLAAGCRVKRKSFKELDLANPAVVQVLEGHGSDGLGKANLERIPTQTRLIIIPDGRDIELQPNDVGIGISQLVPVVVTALQDRPGLVVIEQPELHVHPRIQAELGDLFIEGVRDGTKQLLIETHSEHLILRLLRRIRETGKGITHRGIRVTGNDVAVYYASREDGQTRSTKIDVDVNGEFIQPWPDDFFEIDFYERFG